MKPQTFLTRFALVTAILSVSTLSSVSTVSIYDPGDETITAPADARIYLAHHFGNRPDELEDPDNVHGGENTQNPNEMEDPNDDNTAEPAGRPDDAPGQPEESRNNQNRQSRDAEN